MDSQQPQLTTTEDSQPSITNDMAGTINNNQSNKFQSGSNQHFHQSHFYQSCNVTVAPAAAVITAAPAAAVPTGSPNDPSSQPAEEEGDADIEYDEHKRVYLPQAMFAAFSGKKGNNNDGGSGEKMKNQPSKAHLKVAEEFFRYYKHLDQKQFRTCCPVDKSPESVNQFACLLLSIVEGLEIQAVNVYESVAIESINMHAVSNFDLLCPLRKLSDIQSFLQAARLTTQSSSSLDPLLPLQILLSVYRLNEEASDFVKQTLPNLINDYGRNGNLTWMNFAIKIIDGRQNHTLVTHLNNKCRTLKRVIHDAEQRVFAMQIRVRMPKSGPDHHVYQWTEHGGGRKKEKKVYIVIPRSLSEAAPKSIEDVKALLRPAQQQPLPPEHGQFSGQESQFLDMVQDLIRNQYSRDRLVELIDQQFQVLNANGANQESNLTNEGEVGGFDWDDFDLNLFEEKDVTVENESGLVNGSDPGNTKASSTAAGDLFDSSFANEVAEKDKRQQEAEERANNQNSQTQKNEQAAEPNDNADDNGVYEVKEYLSHGNGRVFVEWLERRKGQWGKERFGWIAEKNVQGGLSAFMKKYTPLKEEVPIDSIK
jgi:hypothetical protein